jgi:hypothetical protein
LTLYWDHIKITKIKKLQLPVMKKTKTISLLLVSAALASCQRDFVPLRSTGEQPIDSALLDEPQYEEVVSPSPCSSCCEQAPQNYQPLWNYSFNPIGSIAPFPVRHAYHYHWGKEIPVVNRGNKAIVRSGWGSTAMVTSVVS